MRLIDADELIKVFEKIENDNSFPTDVRYYAIGAQHVIKKAPTIEPTKALENEKPQGEWGLVERFNFIDIVCPYCNNVRFPSYAYSFSIEEVKEHLKSEKLPNYCESCGAKMRGGMG